ncbi:MAG: hypothetical protein WCG80_19075 [Spirochaetales bacterium]
MMTFQQVLETVGGTVIVKGSRWDVQEIQHVMACSLMSDVLVTEEDDILLVTSLASDQTARTADMVGACGIVLMNDKTPQAELVALCRELDLPLMTSSLPAFECCWQLGNRLNGPATPKS